MISENVITTIIIVFILIIFILIILFVFLSLKNIFEKIKKISNIIGLNFYSLPELAYDSEFNNQNKHILDLFFQIYKKQNYSISFKNKKKPINKNLLFLFPWIIHGNYNNIETIITTITRSSGKSSSTYTIFSCFHNKELPFELLITREDFFSKIGKSLFHSQDIQIGFDKFDKEVIIKGNDQNKIIKLLSNSELQDLIIKFFKKTINSYIDNKQIYAELYGYITKKEKYIEILDIITLISKYFKL